MLMELDSCEMSFFRKYLQHLNEEESTDLIAGGAFAAGLEAARKAFFDEGLSEFDAVLIGTSALEEHYGEHIPWATNIKTKERMKAALINYFMEYPLGIDELIPLKLQDGTHAIEYSFIHELPFEHPDIPGMPIMITGRADMLASYLGRIWVSDEKTTGQAFTKNWPKQWEARGQFTTYCWGLKKNKIDVYGALVRGVWIGKDSFKFQQLPTSRNNFMIAIWEQQMLEKLKNILEKYKRWKDSGKHPLEIFHGAWNDNCFKYFKPCPFQELCRDKNSEQYLESQYTQNIWLPHEQRRIPLADFLADYGIENSVPETDFSGFRL
jgi:hypothetical protein